MTKSTFRAGLAAVIVALAAVVPGAASAGIFTLSLSPRSDNADLIRQGLQIYGIVNEAKGKNRAKVDQKGRSNEAAVSQKGKDNYALVYQRGRGHAASLRQAGRNNAYGIFQFGKKTDVDVMQYGKSDVGLLLQGRLVNWSRAGLTPTAG